MIYASYTFPVYLKKQSKADIIPNESKTDIINDISKHAIDLINNVDDIDQKYQDYQTTHSIERREEDMVIIEKDVAKSIEDVEIIYTDIQKIRKPPQSSWWF